MPTIEATYLAPAGLQAVTLTSFAGDDIWPIVPAAGMQVVGADALTIGADGVVSGADGTYPLALVDPAGDGTVYTENYVIGTVDTTAPVLTNATGAATSDTTADVSVSIDEDNGTLYVLVSSGATATADDVISLGQAQAVTAIGVQTASVADLTADSTYYAHFVHRLGMSANQSDVLSSAAFTTEAAPVTTGGDVTTTATYLQPTGWQPPITLPAGYDNYIFTHAEGTQFDFSATDKTGWQFGIEADPTKVELVLSGTEIELRIIGLDDGTGTLVRPAGIDLLNAVLIDPAGDGTAHGFDIDTTQIALYEAPEEAPADAPVIGTITVTDTTVTIPFGTVANATGYEYRTDVDWISVTSPVELTGLPAETSGSVDVRAINSHGPGPQATATFTTLAETATATMGVSATTVRNAAQELLVSTTVARAISFNGTTLYSGNVTTDGQGVLPAVDLSASAVSTGDTVQDSLEVSGVRSEFTVTIEELPS